MNPILRINLFLLLTYTTGFSQQIGIGTEKPHSSAVLDIQSADKGVLVPRMAADQMRAFKEPAEGLLIYNTSSQSFWYFKNVTDGWIEIVANDQTNRQSMMMTSISDADGDTGIETELTANEDRIHFSIGGEEVLEIRRNGNGSPMFNMDFLSKSVVIGNWRKCAAATTSPWRI